MRKTLSIKEIDFVSDHRLNTDQTLTKSPFSHHLVSILSEPIDKIYCSLSVCNFKSLVSHLRRLRGYRLYKHSAATPQACPVPRAGGREGNGYAVRISSPVEVQIDGFLDVFRRKKGPEGGPGENAVYENSRVNASLRGDLGELG